MSAIVAVAVLHTLLPDHWLIEPRWLTPVVLAALLVALLVGDPGKIDRQEVWLRVITGAVIGAITLANFAAAARLVADIVDTSKRFSSDPTGLLGTGAIIWLTNVLAFGLWYWALDRGGAAARSRPATTGPPAFVFPEMQHTDYVRDGWTPVFLDYLSLSFWTATAFSPTDVSAIKAWAKVLMMVEAGASLALGALVVARAVNIL